MPKKRQFHWYAESEPISDIYLIGPTFLIASISRFFQGSRSIFYTVGSALSSGRGGGVLRDRAFRRGLYSSPMPTKSTGVHSGQREKGWAKEERKKW